MTRRLQGGARLPMKERRETVAVLARQVRGGIERLLVGLGWTWDEALSRAVDRLLILEKGND